MIDVGAIEGLLARAGTSVHLARFLEQRYTIVDFPPLGRAQRRDLDRALRHAQVRSLVEMLEFACETDDPLVHAYANEVSALVVGLEARWGAPASVSLMRPQGGVRRGMSRAELGAWATARDPDLEALLDRPLRELAQLFGHAPYAFTTHHGTLVDLIGAKDAPHHFVEQALTFLQLAATALARARAFHVEAEPRRSARPAHPAMARAWDAVRKAGDALPSHGFRPTPNLIATRFWEDPPQLAFLSDMGHRVFARWKFESGELVREPGSEPAIELLRTALDQVLDVLTDPSVPGHALVRDVLTTPAWQRNLTALVEAAAPTRLPPDEEKRELGWRVKAAESGLAVEPLLCRATRSGGYKTRLIAPDSVPDEVLGDPADERTLALVMRWRAVPMAIASQVLLHLVGHPRVFFGSASRPVEVRRSRLEIALVEGPDGTLSVHATVDGAARDLATYERGPDRYSAGFWIELGEAVIHLVEMPRHVARTLARAGSRLRDIPKEAVPAFAAQLDVLSDALPLVLPESLRGARIDGDPRPLVRLRKSDDALHVTVRVRPLPESVPFLPGEGPTQLRAVRGAARVYVERDVDGEPQRVRDAIAAIPLPAAAAEGDFAWAFRFDAPGTHARDGALAVIEAVEANAHRLQVEWTGPLVAVKRPLVKAKLVISSGVAWFALSGTVGEDEATMESLLAAVLEGSSFVPLKKGGWARVSETLRDALGALATAAKSGDASKIGVIHAPLIAALPDAIEVDAPPVFLASLTRLREAIALVPDVPEGLIAELRPYQREGIFWLLRLAHWAPGAVLADDMGLGKTLQAIALLLARSARGPALVVCPTSVVFNWTRELARFAPTLRVRVHHGSGRASIDEVAAGEVLLTSYGVVLRDQERLAGRRFATLIVDEAQAIKNPDAQRSKAIFGLDAEFRLALTGTPVENAASDLWSVFRAVTPGLLGSRESFRSKYEAVISTGDRTARTALAAIVRPFVLRRTKAAVAPELPAKTEIVVDVDLSADERVLYERARIESLERIASAKQGAQRFEVLAALTRLRQLACHPRLRDASSPVPSSKLHVLVRMLNDLRATGNRALVFSQFVEHLELVQAALLAEGFVVRRLDGSTPLEARRREVDAFQAGQGDVFLISLKAGGTGLNLTAATYVFHLDPWWNPAAEDQATDRAHRIGQTQPVTVYRLVSRGTIEQAILGLHGEKRTLAADLLSGSESAQAYDADAMIALLAGASVLPVPPPVVATVALLPVVSPPAAAPAPPAVVPPPALVSPAPDGFAGLRARLEKRLQDELTVGRINRPATVRAYKATAERFLTFAAARGVSERTALIALEPEFLRSDAASKSDRAAGKPVFGHLWAVLATPFPS